MAPAQAGPVWVVMPARDEIAASRRALRSYLAAEDPALRIVVVDNASTDGTADVIGREFPGVECIRHVHNLGFACGANAGIRRALAAEADFVLVTNNDVVVDRAMVRQLVAAMGAGVGACAPLIYYMSDRQRIWSAGFRRGRWLTEMRAGRRGELADGRCRAPYEVDYLLGCAILLSRQALEHVGLFDERYFFYYEDLDLCLRLHEAGYRLLVVPMAEMWHDVARSAGAESAFRTFHMARGSLMLTLAHTRGAPRLVGLGYRLLAGARKTACYAAARRPDLIRAQWRGTADGWRCAHAAA